VIGQEGFVPLKHSRIFTQKSRILLGILCCFKAQNKDEQMGYMSWTACYTAIDFRARLRFPRAVSLLVACTSAGSHPFRFSRRSLRLVLQSTARTNYTHKIYIQHNNKKTRTTNQQIINSSHLTSTEILLSQPHFYYLFNLFFYDLFFS